jgi:hypothetical protein
VEVGVLERLGGSGWSLLEGRGCVLQVPGIYTSLISLAAPGENADPFVQPGTDAEHTSL